MRLISCGKRVFCLLRLLCLPLLGAQSKPVLQSILSEANTIKDQKVGHVGLFGVRVQKVSALVRDNVQAPAHCVVAHLHQLV